MLAGGLTPGDVTTDAAYRISAAGIGVRLPALAEPVHDAAGVALAGRILILGGGNTRELSAVEAAAPGRPWQIAGRLPAVRSDLSALTTRRGVLVIGGYGGQRALRSVLISPDGQTFRPFARLRRGTRYAATLLVGDSVWVFGGEDAGRELRTTQVIDLTTGQVTTRRPLPTPLGHAAVTLIGSRILLVGGRTTRRRVTAAMWWCDPATGRFSRAGRLPYPVADSGVFPTPNAVYLLGGEAPQFTRSVTKIEWH